MTYGLTSRTSLLNAMGKHVPSKLTSSRPTYPWITTAVRRGINRKNKAGRKAKTWAVQITSVIPQPKPIVPSASSGVTYMHVRKKLKQLYTQH